MSKNLFFKKVLTNNLLFKSPEEIKRIFEENEFDFKHNIIFSCGSGMSASVEFLAAVLAGKKTNVSVYDGSWTEYGTLVKE